MCVLEYSSSSCRRGGRLRRTISSRLARRDKQRIYVDIQIEWITTGEAHITKPTETRTGVSKCIARGENLSEQASV